MIRREIIMIKQLLGIELPLVAGRQAIIYLKSGDRARTFPKKINEIKYESGQLLVTFTTTHSLYQSPIKVLEDPERPVEGQVIREGSEVWNTAGGREHIEGIVDVTEEGIGVRTKTGIFNGKVKLADYKPE